MAVDTLTRAQIKTRLVNNASPVVSPGLRLTVDRKPFLKLLRGVWGGRQADGEGKTYLFVVCLDARDPFAPVLRSYERSHEVGISVADACHPGIEPGLAYLPVTAVTRLLSLMTEPRVMIDVVDGNVVRIHGDRRLFQFAMGGYRLHLRISEPPESRPVVAPQPVAPVAPQPDPKPETPRPRFPRRRTVRPWIPGDPVAAYAFPQGDGIY